MPSVRTSLSPSVRTRPSRRAFSGACSAVLAVALGLGACASGQGARKAPEGGTATFVAPGSGTTLRIVSDAWVASQGYEGESAEERRADYYGKTTYAVSGSAAVKVCDDAVFAGIVEALDSAGFAKHAASGPAPTSGLSGQVLELTEGADARHFLRTKGMPLEAAKDFAACLNVFGEVFNALDGYQAGDKGFRFKE